jgi:hypothetical protein
LRLIDLRPGYAVHQPKIVARKGCMRPHARYLFSRFKAFFCSVRQLKGDDPAVMQRNGRNVFVAAMLRHKLWLSALRMTTSCPSIASMAD